MKTPKLKQGFFPKKRTNLQRFSTRFVGRDTVLTTLDQYFESRVLLTLLGPPGVGKTRLSIEFGLHTLSKQFQEVWFCDLSEATNLEDLIYAVGRTLQIPLNTGGETAGIISQIGTALSYRKDTLLILDNFEHLVEYAAQTVGAWCKASPGTKFLVTSRERLRLQEEFVFDLSPLEVPKSAKELLRFSSVELFLERAKMVRQEYAPKEKELEIIAELVRQLDGLPLAIELAAARIRLLSPSQILEKLQKRFELLNTASIGGQVTLLKTIGYSWDLLAPYEQGALSQCAVFRGGFTLEDAEQVIDLSSYETAPWIIDVLQSLCDKSLLKSEELPGFEGERRFSLYLSIKDYAWQRLNKEKQKEIFERYVAYFLQKGERLREVVERTGQTDIRRQLSLSIENFLAIYRELIKRTPYTQKITNQIITIVLILAASLEAKGPYEQLLSILNTALDMPKHVLIHTKAHISLLISRGLVCRALGKINQSHSDVQTAYAIYQREKFDAKESENALILSQIFQGLMVSLYLQGKPKKAKEYGKKGLQILEKIKNDRRKALIYSNFSLLEEDWGNLKQATQYAENALAICQQTGDRVIEGMVLLNLGNLALEKGFLKKAESFLTQSLLLNQETDDREGKVVVLFYLGILRQIQKNFPETLKHFKSALSIAQMIGHERHEGLILEFLAICSLEAGAFSESRQYFMRSLQIYLKINYRLHEIRLRSFLGVLEVREGNVEAAKQQFDIAKRQISNQVNPIYITAHNICLAQLDLAYAKESALRGEIETEKRHREAASNKIATVSTSGTKHIESRGVLIHLALRSFEKFQANSFMLSEAVRAKKENNTNDIDHAQTSDSYFLVHNDGKWVRLPSGEFVDLEGRYSMSLIVQALANSRRKNPGKALSWKELLSIGWPGETIQANSGRNRVYATLSMLRNLGLRKILKTKRGGYFLDAKIPVIFSEKEKEQL